MNSLFVNLNENLSMYSANHMVATQSFSHVNTVEMICKPSIRMEKKVPFIYVMVVSARQADKYFGNLYVCNLL